MLHISVQNPRQQQQLTHPGGPVEFGRGPRRGARRVLVQDLSVSRDQLRVEELPEGRVRLENLSEKREVALEDGTPLAVGSSRELPLPVRLTVGETVIEIGPDREELPETGALLTVSRPLQDREGQPASRALGELGETPAPETLAHWLETVIALQRWPGGAGELYERTARALVELVGLDLGLVLLRHEDAWSAAASFPAGSGPAPFSRTVLDRVLAERRTFYQDWGDWPAPPRSLGRVQAVVASPVFGAGDEVAGALYGVRAWHGRADERIRPLEAQVVQLLAAAVGADLVRTVALRTRARLEQFFSPELARELERRPDLLEGRDQEVSVLVADLRGFTRLSERLGPETTCAIVRDLMEGATETVAGQGGVIVSYAGDGLLAMWNAPAPQDDHAARACRAGLAMLAEVPALNARWQQRAGAPLALGVGISTGPARVGNIGSSRKFHYGPLGHTVNLASRVQDATKKWGCPLIVTQATRDRLPAGFVTRCLGPEVLSGLAEGVVLYEVRAEGGE